MTPTHDKWKGHMAVLLANVFFGLNIPVMKALIPAAFTSWGYIMVRSVVALATFWVLQCFMPREVVRKRHLALLAVGAFLGFVFSQYMSALSIQHTTPVYFSLIVALSPITTMFLAALFLREPITLTKSLGAVMGVAGVVLMLWQAIDHAAGSNNILGMCIALVGITAFSGYLIIGRHLSAHYSAITQMKWIFLFATFMALPLVWGELLTQPLLTQPQPAHTWWLVAYMLIFPTSVAYFLFPLSMKYIRATTVSVYMNLQPIVAAVAAIAIGQDHFSWDKPIAAILVLCGAYIVSQSKGRKEQ